MSLGIVAWRRMSKRRILPFGQKRKAPNPKLAAEGLAQAYWAMVECGVIPSERMLDFATIARDVAAACRAGGFDREILRPVVQDMCRRAAALPDLGPGQREALLAKLEELLA